MFVVVDQSPSHVQLCDSMNCSTPGFPVFHHLPEFAQTHVDWGSDAIQPSYHLLPPSPPALNLSKHQGLFQWVGFFIKWPKYWSFMFSTSPSNEYSGLISFRIDWLDLLEVQGKTLLQYHSSKASILWCSDFFMVHLSHPYMTTGKTIALTIQNFVSKVIMSLHVNTLSRLVVAFLPRSKHLSHGCNHHLNWFWSPPKIKSATVSIPHLFEVMGPDAMILASECEF